MYLVTKVVEVMPCWDPETEEYNPDLKVLRCSECKRGSVFKILHESSVEAEKCQTHTMFVQCNNCGALLVMNFKNW